MDILFCKIFFFYLLILNIKKLKSFMKKIAAILSVVAIGTITLVSCSKKGDYTCTCTVTDANGNNTTSAGGTWTDVKKSYAEDACKQADASLQTSLAISGGTGGCKLD